MSGFAFTVFCHPPLLSSAWQLEHQGAQRWTTLRPGALIASESCCSAGEAAKSEVARARMRIKASFFISRSEGHAWRTPSICGDFRGAQDASVSSVIVLVLLLVLDLPG